MSGHIQRRDFLRFVAVAGAASALPGATTRAVPAPGKRPNVLLICVDDLRPQLGCYGVKDIVSPNIDRFAGTGRLFLRHYIQSAVCGPSRCSLLTGRRMNTWDCWKEMRKLKTEPENPASIAHLFRRAGYRTVCIGKVSHQPGGVMDPQQKTHEVPFSWDLAYAPVGKWKDPWGAFFCYADGSTRPYGYGRNETRCPAFECADVDDDGYADGLNAAEAIKQLRDLKARGDPFFLAVGFYKPHLPHNAPKKYWDLYDPQKVGLAANPQPPRNADPAICLTQSDELTTHYAWPGGKGHITDEQARNQRRAYFACVSYTDVQVGKVLDELNRLGLAQDTLVILWGDHGWHLGEHGIFCKATNFEIATRSPLIIRTPGMAEPGKPAAGLAEAVDLYPTLADLCGLKAPDNLPGRTLRAMLQDPNAEGKEAAYSFIPHGKYFGRTIRTDRYRLVEWTDTRTKKIALIELYDHQADGQEDNNIAAENPDIVKKLRAVLDAEETVTTPRVLAREVQPPGCVWQS